MDSQGAENMPRDGRVIAEVLKSMGVQDWDPRIIPQLLEFEHRYVADVLQDAVGFSEHAGKDEIDLDDVRLAIQSRVNFSFVQPPPREFMMELAHAKNSVRLPLIPPHFGVRLPEPENCLTSTDFQVMKESKKEEEPKS